jgi:hypothetical protein
VTLAACVDVGSTVTKVAMVDLDGAELVATASHPTTVTTDVLYGLDAAVAATGLRPDVTYACSSAGGGLRLAVVGYEALVSAEAARRVALSAGARVVHVAAGPLDRAGLAALRGARPDVLLLVGGADGGDVDTVLHNARRLGAARWRRPTVLAGNVDATARALTLLAGVPVTVCPNVLPEIGRLCPGPARAAIREVFLRHVIGGKRLSRGPRFAGLVRAATPDAVLTAVERLAGAHDLLVVDVGGATTDVYSVLAGAEQAPPVPAYAFRPGEPPTPVPAYAFRPGEPPTPVPAYAFRPGEPPTTVPAYAFRPGGHGDVAGTARLARTVEGDLGVRWSATGVTDAAAAERLDPSPDLVAAARRLSDAPQSTVDDADLPLAALAATVALRRHGRGEPVAGPGSVRRGGRDLGRVTRVIGSGGVFRHAHPSAALDALRAAACDAAFGATPELLVDTAYVLAPAGLLAADRPAVCDALLRRHLHRQ